jgi:DEAD/DEAH box helicase domain-containing protein
VNDDFISLLCQTPGYRSQIVHVEYLSARQASFATPSQPLAEPLQRALQQRGIEQLYAHQAAALDLAYSGQHFGVVTATASGKTLCYQLPTLNTLSNELHARALFLFPTKALAHDQLRSLRGMVDALNDQLTQADTDFRAARLANRASQVRIASFDGDTPMNERDQIRQRTNIVLSNPDMLHRSLLPDHTRWADWLRQLRYVVIDEAHVYRGVFGTHVALILRRLQRICAYYGSAPQFICCSATSANPAEHLAALVGSPVQIINQDGAPQGQRTFVFWNPPQIDQSEMGKRRSTNIETANLLGSLVSHNVKTLAFARSRRATELILRYTREVLDMLTERPNPDDYPVKAYRAGYQSDERRGLERDFQSGALTGMISTNALELGVDIGGVDAVIMGGFPGTIASTWQQAGRAGRSQGQSLAVLIAQDDPIDQFYMRHPSQFFARNHEHARVALQNPYILSDQLCCAAREIPLQDADEVWFGPTMPVLRDWLVRHDRLRQTPYGAQATQRQPAADINIRSVDGANITLYDVDKARTIEQLAASRAAAEAHPGAIYLYQGDTYLVHEWQDEKAHARRVQVNYYTQTYEDTEITIERITEQREVGPATLCFGVVQVTRQVVGYRRLEQRSEALLSEHDLEMPPYSFRTQAVWWTLPEAISGELARACGDPTRFSGEGFPGALHAMEHAAISLLPLFAQCDRWDIGGVSTSLHRETNLATIFVYDGAPGGVGISQVGYEQAEEWWQATFDLLRDCPCTDGCPSCVHSPKCGNGNHPLNKQGALMLTGALLGQPISKQQTASLAPKVSLSRGSILDDLRGRLTRARTETNPVQRLALLAALRYRISLERGNPHDEVIALALDTIEAEIEAMSRR